MTKLIEVKRYTKPYRGAEVKFTRQEGRIKHTIYACKCYESWSQWGAPEYVLGDNVPAVERWRNGTI